MPPGCRRGLAQARPGPDFAADSKETNMRRILLSTLAATTLLSAGLLASRAAATTSAGAISAGSASATLLREASILCGSNGCNVVQTKGTKQRKLQWLGHG